MQISKCGHEVPREGRQISGGCSSSHTPLPEVTGKIRSRFSSQPCRHPTELRPRASIVVAPMGAVLQQSWQTEMAFTAPLLTAG